MGKPTQRSEVVVDHSEFQKQAQETLIHDLMMQAENGGKFYPTIIDEEDIERLVDEEIAAENEAKRASQGKAR